MVTGDFIKLRNWLLKWEDDIEVVTYQISECFNNRIEVYNAINISISLEDGVVWSSDAEDVILKRDRGVFKGFILKDAGLILKKNFFIIRLKNGDITVKISE